MPICLQLDDCEKAGRLKGGILTPASAMGPVLLDRLQHNADCRFSISPAVGHRSSNAGPQSPGDGQNPSQSKM